MAMEKLVGEIDIESGYVVAIAKAGSGAEIGFPKVTVGGTHTALIDAALARGTTVLRNAAREPEIVDLADCLNKMGARIFGAGSSRSRSKALPRCMARVMPSAPDRIEAGTYAMAVAMTGGKPTVVGAVGRTWARFCVEA